MAPASRLCCVRCSGDRFLTKDQRRSVHRSRSAKLTRPVRSLLVRRRSLRPSRRLYLRCLLAKFGLKADHVTRAAGELSPGERTRAGLALLQARGVNVLVLDEPTNHLDLAAIEQLEQALESYEGTLLLVTHDRRMLNTVQLDRRWHVEAGTVTELA